jgi:Tol biopolymer transport system component
VAADGQADGDEASTTGDEDAQAQPVRNDGPLSDSLVGQWERIDGEDWLVAFYADGTVSFTSDGATVTGEYAFVADDQVQISLIGISGVFVVGIGGNRMTLTNEAGETMEFERMGEETSGSVRNVGNLRSEPRLDPATVIAQVCPGDQVTILERRAAEDTDWVRVRVTEPSAEDCGPERAEAGAEGWIVSTLVSAPTAPAATSEAAAIAPTPVPPPPPPPTPVPPTPTVGPQDTIGKIAYASDRGDGRFEVFLMNEDGSETFRLTSNTGFFDTRPTLSPDNQHIAFVSNRFGNDDIYVMDANGSNQISLTSSSGEDRAPVWSPDGSRLAFESNRDGNFEIYVMNADGTDPTRLTYDPAIDGSPTWSPDGGWLAFQSNRDGNTEIYVMCIEDGSIARLTYNDATDGLPAWSPDNTRIAFTSDRDGEPEIFVMSTDGSQQTNLTNNDVIDVRPVWSPDSTRLAFASNRDGNFEIYVINADGSNPRRLTDNPAPDMEPAWAP